MTLRRTSTVQKAALLAILSVGLVGGGAAAIDDPYVFDTIDPPGATWSEAYGINPGGEVVGVYGDAAGVWHGFLMSGGEFTTIDYPGANRTLAVAINSGGDILGQYRMPGSSSLRGFVLTKHGDLVPIDVPGHPVTQLTRILPDGTILGCFHSPMYGFTMKDGEVSDFTETSTMHFGATPDGEMIVGRWIGPSGSPDYPGFWGYVIEGVDFTRFRFPDSAFTIARDVNPAREIVGFYRPIGSTAAHGFLMRDWEFTTLDYPGALQTWALGINPGGDVVGSYYGTDRPGAFAFLASRTGWDR